MSDDLVSALDQGDFEAALRIAHRALVAQDPKMISTALKRFAQLGDKLLKNGQAEQAAAVFRQACIAAPDAASLRFRHGIALRQCGAMAEATTEVRNALSLQPHFPQAAIELVNLLQLQGSSKRRWLSHAAPWRRGPVT